MADIIKEAATFARCARSPSPSSSNTITGFTGATWITRRPEKDVPENLCRENKHGRPSRMHVAWVSRFCVFSLSTVDLPSHLEITRTFELGFACRNHVYREYSKHGAAPWYGCPRASIEPREIFGFRLAKSLDSALSPSGRP